jgi:hypothetical protein
VSAATGTYGGSTTFTATLTSSSNPVSGKTINFTLNGNPAGSGITDANGVATSSSVLLYGSSYTAGVYPTGAAARPSPRPNFSCRPIAKRACVGMLGLPSQLELLQSGAF